MGYGGGQVGVKRAPPSIARGGQLLKVDSNMHAVQWKPERLRANSGTEQSEFPIGATPGCPLASGRASLKLRPTGAKPVKPGDWPTNSKRTGQRQIREAWWLDLLLLHYNLRST